MTYHFSFYQCMLVLSWGTIGTTWGIANKPLYTAIYANDIQTVACIITQNSALIHQALRPLYSPLMIAVEAQQYEMVELFISYGADVNYQYVSSAGDGSGPTALILAAEQGNVALIQLLLDAGALCNRAERAHYFSAGITPLSGAISSGSLEAVQQILAYGGKSAITAYVSHQKLWRKSPDHEDFVRERRLSQKYGFLKQVRNIPLLSYAVKREASVEIIKALIAAGVEVDPTPPAFSDTCWTPLKVAQWGGYTDVLPLLAVASTVQNY